MTVKLARICAAAAMALCLLGTAGSAVALTGCGSDAGPGQPGNGEDLYAGCCKVCSIGKACGDTCISRSYDCHVGAGCACDA